MPPETSSKPSASCVLVESAHFFAERAQFARRVRDAHTDARATTQSHPEPVSTFLSLRGAPVAREIDTLKP
jgi:hypothetical protein